MNEPQAKPASDMTDSELQRAIAELRGWTSVSDEDGPDLTGLIPNPTREYDFWVVPTWPQDTHAACVDLLAEMEGYNLRWSTAYHGWSVENYNVQKVRRHTHPARAIAEAWYIWKIGGAS